MAHGDDAERAARAGLRVLEAIGDLNHEQPGLDLSARAAVATGEAVVAIGSAPELGGAIAMGDVVNIASRLQAAAPSGRLIVGEETYRATRHAIRYEDMALKGSESTVGIMQPSGTRGSIRRGRPSARSSFSRDLEPLVR